MTASSSPGPPAVTRLSLATLDALPRGDTWSPPEVDPRALGVGVVHLGVGVFHRAHQAVYTERAAALTGSTQWGIAGVTQRSSAVRDQLAPQDGLYGVLERGEAVHLRVVGSIRRVLDGRGEAEDVLTLLADPAVHVVTLTVTEKGYRTGVGGGLDLDDPDVREDVHGGPGRTVAGRLVRGLQRRYVTSGAALTVVSCDNLTGNGRVLRRVVEDFVEALSGQGPSGFADWLGASVRFPASMVDRIVPATTPLDRAEARVLLGADDAGLVVAEPYRQWVLEDDFAAPRPAWERAGALLTDDVTPWETAKLRVLNAAHSMLAYLGALRGYETIAEAVRDDDLAGDVRALLVEDVSPTLCVPAGLDLPAYREDVLERFANPALAHRTVQVAMDGSQKLPVRLLGTVRDRLAAGVVPRWAVRAVAGWMVYVSAGQDAGGRPLPLEDPLAPRLREVAARAGDARVLVDGLLGVQEVFGDDLPEHADLRAALVEEVAALGGRRAVHPAG
ncbi:MAG: mannitol dehydrogenase family protein [Actinomycetes bacterium]